MLIYQTFISAQRFFVRSTFFAAKTQIPKACFVMACLCLGVSEHVVLAQYLEPAFQVDDLPTVNYMPLIQPRVATQADGAFIVVWGSSVSSGTDTSGLSIQGRRFASDGTPQAAPFQVNTYTTGDQGSPDVAGTPNGGFVVVWGHQGVDINDPTRGIHGQLHSSTGVPLGPPFQLTGANPNGQSVAMNEDGFIVTWHDNGIRAQRFTSEGTFLGATFQINAYTTGNPFFPDVAMDPSGGFIVAWSNQGSPGDDTSLNSVLARRFGSDGMPLGSDFQVNAYTTDNQWFPTASTASDGSFVIAWQRSGPGGTSSPSRIMGRRYASDGSSVGSPFQVSAYTTGNQTFPAVSMQPNGEFAVVWDIPLSAGDANSQGRFFDADGTPFGEQFRITPLLAGGFNFGATAAPSPGGRFVVVWHSSYYAGGLYAVEHIQGRRVRPDFFADGFESGDTSWWSGTVP